MTLTLTIWQKKGALRPTRAGVDLLDDPSVEAFDDAVTDLLATVVLPEAPFQIVAQVGCSSRGFQLGQGWSDERIKSELWTGYQSLTGVNG